MNKYVYPTIVSLMLILMIGLITQGPFTTRSLIPDGVAQEAQGGVCDGEVDAAAFALCNAYCYYMNCGSAESQGLQNACEKVAENFHRITSRSVPCEVTY